MFSGSVSSCPGIFTLEIFVENISTRLSVFDMLVSCPKNFSVNFTIKRENDYLFDIFILVLNDTSTSHRIILSSVQGPQLFTSASGSSDQSEDEITSPWLPIIVIITVCVCSSLLLLMINLYCSHQKPDVPNMDIKVPKPDLGTQITLLKNIDKGFDKRMTVQTKCIRLVLFVLYFAYAIVFTFSVLFLLFNVFQGSSLNTVTMATNISSQIQSRMQQKLDDIVNHENKELSRMFNLTAGRIQACNAQLKKSLWLKSPEANSKLLDVIKEMFEQDGTVQKRLSDYFAKRHSVYQKDIDRFLSEFNNTVDKNLHKVQVMYASYLKSVAENNWLKFPLGVFKKQLVLEGRQTGKLSDYLADFLTWLEIDKVQEIFEIKEIVMNR